MTPGLQLLAAVIEQFEVKNENNDSDENQDDSGNNEALLVHSKGI